MRMGAGITVAALLAPTQRHCQGGEEALRMAGGLVRLACSTSTAMALA
jgi:hypothetical protein